MGFGYPLYKKLGITRNELKQLLIIKYYFENKTNQEISKELECHRANLTDWFKEFKIPFKEKNGKPRKKVIYKHPKRLPDGEAAFNNCYSNYRSKANYRNIEFNLDKDTFRKITSSNCHYCNCIPSMTIKAGKNSSTGCYIYNGIDRVDSNLEYNIDNIVPCCYICNVMKSSLSVDEWFNHMEKILKCQKKI